MGVRASWPGSFLPGKELLPCYGVHYTSGADGSAGGMSACLAETAVGVGLFVYVY
jgi:hypothetical protein